MPSAQTTTRFGLIRHAETEWNRENRIQGHLDSSLTGSGKKEADGWGRLLKGIAWDRIFGSDLGRAVETAALINHHLKIPFGADSRLREQDWGDWSAKPAAQIEKEELDKLDKARRFGWQFCPPGGEDRISVWQRSYKALVDAASKWPGETILVVTHEGVIKSLVYRLAKYKFSPDEPLLIESRHLHWLISNRGELEIHQLNALQLS